jgi:HEAT repeat protein
MAVVARDILACEMHGMKTFLMFLLAITCFLPCGAALGATVKDGGFTCSASTQGEVTSVRIVHGAASLERTVPPGTWSVDGLGCQAWQGKAVRLVLPSPATGAYEIFAGLDGENLEAAWEGRTGMSGDFGERWGWFLDWEPREPGAKALVPILYALHEQVRLCGYGMVPLYVRLYDPASRTFRPVSFDRTRRAGQGWGDGAAPSEAPSTGKPITIISTLAPKKEPLAVPVLDDFLNFKSSSSSAGDKGDPTLGSAPLGLGDGMPQSGWVEGAGGHGWGEFVTAGLTEASLPITSLVLQATRGPDDPDRSRWNRVKKITLTTSSGARYIVKIPSDPLKSPDRPVVITFPKPVQTSCLSIIVQDVYKAKKTGGEYTYLGEVSAYTSLDTGEGIAALLDWFEDPGRSARASELLADLNPSALPAVVDAWDTLGPAPRLGVVDAIHADWTSDLVPLVTTASAGAWADEDADLFALLVDRLVPLAADETILAAAGDWMLDSSRQDLGVLAVGVLGRAGREQELGELIDALFAPASQTWEPWPEVELEEWIREGLRSAGPAGIATSDAALAAAQPGGDEHVLGAALTLLYLQDYATGGEDVRQAVAGWARDLWDAAPTLYCHHHLLPVARKLISLGDGAGIDIAARALEDPDAPAGLRVEALAVIATAGGDLVPRAVEAALAALDDPGPGVRAAAVTALRRVGASGQEVEERVVEIGVEDAWPEVRLEAIRLATAFDEVPIEAVWDFLRDKNSSARKQAIRLVLQKHIATEEVGILLANTSLSKAMRPDVRAEAAHAIGTLCLVQMADPMGNIVFYGTTPDAGEGEIQAAAAAAETLGMLGDDGPVGFLVDATRPGLRLEIRIAAMKSLGILGGKKARKVLTHLSKSPDPAVRAAAVEALASLEQGVQATCASKE